MRIAMILRRVATLLPAALALSFFSCGVDDGRPSVLLIVVDTLRADRLGCYGYSEVQTPNVDRLASEGVRFTTVVTAAPVTAPSVATILTSTYPTVHGVRDNELFVLNASLPRIASAFKQAGYTTAAFVGSVVLDSKYGFAEGFDYYDDDMSAEFAVFDPTYASQFEGLQGTQRRAGDVTASTLGWLEENRKLGPFFCFVHYFDPHLNYDPPPPYNDTYLLSPYDGEVAYTDSQIGALLSGVEELGLADDALVVLTGDHGEGLGDHGEGSHGFFLYDTTVKVPLIFSQTGTLPSGLTISSQARTVDIMPTVLDLAGLPVPGTAQGVSLAPALLGGARPAPRDAYIETYHTLYSYSWHEMQALRTPDWKYVRSPEAELYDLKNDPGEANNLAARDSKALAKMESALAGLEESIAGGSANLKALRSAPDDEMTRKMLALGYIGTPSRRADALPRPGGDLPDPKAKVRAWNSIQEARGYMRAALTLQKEKDYAGALRAIAVAESIAPDYAEVIATKGLILKRSGNIGEGIRVMKIAVEMNPRSEMAYQTLNNLGVAYLETDRCDEAIAAFERSLMAKPGYWRAALNLAGAYERCGDEDRAAEGYEACLRAVPPEDTKTIAFLREKIAALKARAGRN